MREKPEFDLPKYCPGTYCQVWDAADRCWKEGAVTSAWTGQDGWRYCVSLAEGGLIASAPEKDLKGECD